MADRNHGQPGPGWFWADGWQMWVRPDHEQGRYFTQNGQQFPMDSGTPRNMNIPQQMNVGYARAGSSYGASPPNQPGYHHMNAEGTQADPEDSESLADNFARLQVTGEQEFVDETNAVVTVTVKGSDAFLDPELANLGFNVNLHVRGSGGVSERFFPNYRRHPKPGKMFVVGRVIEMLWSEPAGEALNGRTLITNRTESTVAEYAGRVFSKYRRFIVVRAGHKSCTAVAILTYGGQGVAKKDVKKCEHGIVYVSGPPPKPKRSEIPQRGEAPMLPNAIRVDPDSRQEKLSEMSRVNYGKVYTIEHNVMVRSLGMVSPESMGAFLNNFRLAWHGPEGCEVEDRPSGSVQHANTARSARAEASAGQIDPRVVAELRRLAAGGLTREQAEQYMEAQRVATMKTFRKAIAAQRSPAEAFSMVQRMVLPQSLAEGRASAAGKQQVEEMVMNHYILGPLYARVHGQTTEGENEEDSDDAGAEEEQGEQVEQDDDSEDDGEDEAEARQMQYRTQQSRHRRPSTTAVPSSHSRRKLQQHP